MNFSKAVFTTAIAASAVATMQQAAAWTPTWPLPASVQIWHGGASASTSTVQGAVCDAICDPAFAVDVFEDARSVGKPDFWFVACKGKAGTGSLAGKDILWSKRDEGGSGVGVGPVVIPKAIGFMKPSTGAVGTNFDPALEVGAKAPVVKACGTVAGATYRFSTGFTVPGATSEADPLAEVVSREPNIGTSDIEPDKFTPNFPLNVPVVDMNLDGLTDAADGLGAFSSAGLTTVGLGILTFNTPVNLRMYLDLQAAQFPDATHPLYSKCNPLGATYGNVSPALYSGGMPTAGGLLDPRNNANSEDCMPSLTRSEINSIFAVGGLLRTSLDVKHETVWGTGAFNTGISTIASRGSTHENIQICRRVAGSGTQAQFNAEHMGYPCDATFDGSIDTLIPETESAFNTFVDNNPSSGDVEKCLNDYNAGTDTSTKNPSLWKRWAIGIQSLEKNPPVETVVGSGVFDKFANAYRWIKIDEASPCLENVHAGDYWNYARQTIQYRTAGPIGSGATATEIVDAWTFVGASLSSPSVLAKLNKPASFCINQNQAGSFSAATSKSVGWLAYPTSTIPQTQELDRLAPVAMFDHASASHTKQNSCAQPSAIPRKGSSTADVTVGPQYCQEDDANLDGDQNCYTP
jgi:hypothetical protein